MRLAGGNLFEITDEDLPASDVGQERRAALPIGDVATSGHDAQRDGADAPHDRSRGRNAGLPWTAAARVAVALVLTSIVVVLALIARAGSAPDDARVEPPRVSEGERETPRVRSRPRAPRPQRARARRAPRPLAPPTAENPPAAGGASRVGQAAPAAPATTYSEPTAAPAPIADPAEREFGFER